MVPALVLASTSPYRRGLLQRLGVPFTVRPPACDEEALKPRWQEARALAEGLAEAKSAAIDTDPAGAVVIGSDQVAAWDGGILGKPRDLDEAERQLLSLSGGQHRLITAVCVRGPLGCHRHTEICTMTMRPLDRTAVRRYLAAEDPVGCAGAYRIEGRGIGLFSRIECRDHDAIIGLPLIALADILIKLGYAIP